MPTIDVFLDLDRAQLGQRLRALRERRGLTLASVAWRAEMHEPYSRAIEQGTASALRATHLYKVCMVLRVSADWLLGLPDAAPPA